MGRYSTVQAYSDNNPNMRAVSHSTASASSSTGGALRTEKVYNPYGSTAGAGSGEFHIYRHARAREMLRLKGLDEEEQRQQELQEFDSKVNSWKNEEEEKLNKKRKKRMRNKTSKLRKKNMNLSGVINRKGSDGNDQENFSDEDEFQYTPLNKNENEDEDEDEKKKEEAEKNNDVHAESKEKEDVKDGVKCRKPASDKDGHDKKIQQPPLPFKNDGSFLEMMKKMQSNSSTEN